MRVAHTRAGRAALGAAAAAGVRHMAHRFIVGETPGEALGALRSLWDRGAGASLDLLGEATVTEAEADGYAERSQAALDELAAASARGPSSGLVLQAYLRDSPEQLERVLEWARAVPRTPPLVVRLVKGAYWDHEVIEAGQHGWPAPVFEDKADCDRNFEALTRTL